MTYSRIFVLFFISFFCISNAIAEKLKFKSPEEYSTFSNINNAVFLPSKKLTSPTPAVILLPSCDGIQKNSRAGYLRWTKFFLENGYAVLTVDHYQGRSGQQEGCSWIKRKVSETEMVRDLYDAVEYLSNIPNIDKNRIFSLGFSLGAMTNGLAASQRLYERLIKNKLRPRAVGGLYGACHYDNNVNFLFPDTSIPLIWLMGANDTDTPASDCLEVLNKIKKLNKAKVVWHIYPETSHCWDCREKNGFVLLSGHTMRYNENSTEDSKKRVLGFFGSFK